MFKLQFDLQFDTQADAEQLVTNVKQLTAQPSELASVAILKSIYLQAQEIAANLQKQKTCAELAQQDANSIVESMSTVLSEAVKKHEELLHLINHARNSLNAMIVDMNRLEADSEDKLNRVKVAVSHGSGFLEKLEKGVSQAQGFSESASLLNTIINRVTKISGKITLLKQNEALPGEKYFPVKEIEL